MKAVTALLFSSLAVQQAAATFSWNPHAKPFTCPDNTDNKCDDDQKGGWGWVNLPTGNFNKYKDFDFEGGWKCGDRFGKRDLLSKRTFQSKCVQAPVTKQQTPPKISCTKKNFSIKEFQVSVDVDEVDIEFHYTMPDGSNCKHVAPCKAGGSVVRNTQCGGAKEVTFKIPQKHKHSKCNLGFHHIDFDCLPPKNPPKPKPTTSSKIYTTTSKPVEKPTTTTVVGPVTTTSVVVVSSSSVVSSSVVVPSSSSSIIVFSPTSSVVVVSSSTTAPGSSTGVFPLTSTTAASSSALPTLSTTSPATSTPPVLTTSTIFSTITSTINNCGPTVTNCPAGSSTVVTSIVAVTTTVCPVTDVPPAPTETPKGSSTAASAPTSSVPAVIVPPGQDCPPVLPKCLNTWMFKTGCDSNTAADCYCKNADFTKNVFDCVDAWASDEVLCSAYKFFTGICAPYIKQNPALVLQWGVADKCPSGPVVSSAVPIPTTVIGITATVEVPCTYTTGPSAGLPIPSSSTIQTIMTSATVPQIIFTTAPGATSTGFGLVPGTAPVPAPTAATTLGTVTAPAATSTSPVPFLGAGSRVGGSSLAAAFGMFLAVLAL